MEGCDDFARAYNERVRAMIEADLARGGVSTKAETAPKPKPKPKPKPGRVKVDEGGYYWDDF